MPTTATEPGAGSDMTAAPTATPTTAAIWGPRRADAFGQWAESSTTDEHHCPVRRHSHSRRLVGKTAPRGEEHVPPDPGTGFDAGLDGTEDEGVEDGCISRLRGPS